LIVVWGSSRSEVHCGVNSLAEEFGTRILALVTAVNTWIGLLEGKRLENTC
jgi:hypothetical protein